VNILAEDQRRYTRQFAAREAGPGARFAGVPFTAGSACGVPLLDGALAAFECEVRDIYPFGGHDIVVARVERAAGRDDGQPVVHYDGQLYGLAVPGDVTGWNPRLARTPPRVTGRPANRAGPGDWARSRGLGQGRGTRSDKRRRASPG
jgi:hypothetical protein